MNYMDLLATVSREGMFGGGGGEGVNSVEILIYM